MQRKKLGMLGFEQLSGLLSIPAIWIGGHRKSSLWSAEVVVGSNHPTRYFSSCAETTVLV
ncbi:MAG: hypothetical protein ACJ71R_12790 [Nitrososphaeraceae archaeon]